MKSSSTFSKNNIDTLAIGRFDGLHLGHYKLFEHLGESGGVFVVDTNKANLTPPKYLSQYLQIPFFVYSLDDIKLLTPTDFIAKLISDFPGLNRIVVGEDFRFGKDRGAGIVELKSLFQNVKVVEDFKLDGIPVHSRYIRSLLLNGSIDKATKFLGRYYRICGGVVSGQGLGSKELYPTININCTDFILPSEGVYITKTLSSGNEYNSVSFLGHRVSTDGNYALETHILSDNIEHDEYICLDFIMKIRKNIFFQNILELKTQIEADICIAREFFGKI